MSIFSAGDMKRNIAGQVTANGASTVTLNVQGLEANSFVHIQPNTISGTIAAMSLITKTPATSGGQGVLQWVSTAGNTTVYDVYVLV